MKIKTENVEQELTRLATAILRDPGSWGGWSCLVTRVRPAIQNKIDDQAFVPVREFLASFLQKTEGTSYFCHNAVYVVCRDLPQELLEDVADNVCGISFNGEPLFWAHDLYHFPGDAARFIEHVEHHRNVSEEMLRQQAHPFWHPEKIAKVARGEDIATEEKIFVLERRHHNDAPDQDQKPFERILLVDDDPVILWMVRHALKHECELACASSAQEAFASYEQERPDVVLLDINLPDQDGYQVLHWIMKNDPTACVIMISGHSDMENLVSALQDGACAFIPKPFSKSQLIEAIRSHIGRLSDSGPGEE